jgi:hypothetical protein
MRADFNLLDTSARLVHEARMWPNRASATGRPQLVLIISAVLTVALADPTGLSAQPSAPQSDPQNSPNREWACEDFTLLTTTSRGTGTLLVARRLEEILGTFKFKTIPGDVTGVSCAKSKVQGRLNVTVVSKPPQSCATRTTSLTWEKSKFSQLGEHTDDPCADRLSAFRKAAASGDTARAVAELDSLAMPEHYIQDSDWQLLLDTALRESQRHDRAGRSIDAVRAARDATDRIDQIFAVCRQKKSCASEKKRISVASELAKIIRKNGAAGIADILDRELQRMSAKASP